MSAESTHDTDHLAANPVEVTIGGKTYKMSPLGPRDLADFKTHLRKQRYAIHWEGAKSADMPQNQAILIAKGILWDIISPEMVDAELDTPEGILFLAWCGIRKNHPDVARESLQPTQEEHLRLVVAISALNGEGGAANPQSAPTPDGK